MVALYPSNKSLRSQLTSCPYSMEGFAENSYTVSFPLGIPQSTHLRDVRIKSSIKGERMWPFVQYEVNSLILDGHFKIGMSCLVFLLLFIIIQRTESTNDSNRTCRHEF